MGNCRNTGTCSQRQENETKSGRMILIHIENGVAYSGDERQDKVEEDGKLLSCRCKNREALTWLGVRTTARKRKVPKNCDFHGKVGTYGFLFTAGACAKNLSTSNIARSVSEAAPTAAAGTY